jgi:hypothetical protein
MQCNTEETIKVNMGKPRGSQWRYKNKYNQCASRRKLSEIKLKRTDTTLDPVKLLVKSGGRGSFDVLSQ